MPKTPGTAVAKRDEAPVKVRGVLNLSALDLHCDRGGCTATFPYQGHHDDTEFAAQASGWVIWFANGDDPDNGVYVLCPADAAYGLEDEPPTGWPTPSWPLHDGVAREPGEDVVVLAAARQAQEWKRADEARQREQEAAFARSEQAWNRAITKDDPGTWTGIWGPKVTGSAAAAIDATVADMPLTGDAETVTFWGNDEPEPGRKYRVSARTWWQWLWSRDEDAGSAA